MTSTDAPPPPLLSDLSLPALAHEKAVLTSPYALTPWLRYISYHASCTPPPPLTRIAVFERALAALPCSYKIWFLYSSYCTTVASSLHPSSPAHTHAQAVRLRAARALPHCPALWESAVHGVVSSARWTCLRPLVDEALRALPITLHPRFWCYVAGAVRETFPELAASFMRRAYALRRTGGAGAVELFQVLVETGKPGEAVRVLSAALASGDGASWGGEKRQELWMKLVGVAAKNPIECAGIDVPALVRGAICSAKAEVGELWASLADVYTRLGRFSDARTVYEEALARVSTVRDFAVVFDAAAKFLETMVVSAMKSAADDDDDEGSSDDSDGNVQEMDELSAETLIGDLEALTKRRPMLLSDVWLRQNPHNIHEWHKRAALFKKAGDAAGAVAVFTEAVRTIDPWRATNGRPHTLWLAFSRLYEDASDLPSARKVLDKAVSDPERFKSADDLATLWCEYAEMELRQESPEDALAVLKRATSKPPGFDDCKLGLSGNDGRKKMSKAAVATSATVQLGAGAGNVTITHEYKNSSPAWLAWKNLNVWAFYSDLLESVGTVDKVIAVHTKMLDLELATVQTVMNGAAYLESKRLFEHSFRLLDRATSTLLWPDAMSIWVVYLRKVVDRFGGSKMERVRDLFDQAIKSVPPVGPSKRSTPNPCLRTIILMYAEFEERHGLARHAMGIYSRAVKIVMPSQQAGIYRMFIVRATELFGATRAREIYEDAIESLAKREEVMEMALRYASMETRMGEIERARAVYKHGSQVADPRGGSAYTGYWNAWNAFELAHGSEDTFRDMLRVKRSVQMRNAGIHLISSVAAGAGTVEAAAAAAEAETMASDVAAATTGAAVATGGDGKERTENNVGGGGGMAALERKVLEAQAAAALENGNAAGSGLGGNAEEIDVNLDDEDDGNGNDSEVDALPVDKGVGQHEPDAAALEAGNCIADSEDENVLRKHAGDLKRAGAKIAEAISTEGREKKEFEGENIDKDEDGLMCEDKLDKNVEMVEVAKAEGQEAHKSEIVAACKRTTRSSGKREPENVMDNAADKAEKPLGARERLKRKRRM
jgi:pre-mRNA-splicing factor SYF1